MGGPAAPGGRARVPPAGGRGDLAAWGAPAGAAPREAAAAQHRRAVARIVADQWLWVAREGLFELPARGHRARCLCRAAWAGWNAARARAVVARGLAEARAQARGRQRAAEVLAALWAHAAQAQAQRRATRKADWHWAGALAFRALRAWAAGAAETRARARASRLAARFRVGGLLRRSWGVWDREAAERRKVRAVARQQTLYRALQGWARAHLEYRSRRSVAAGMLEALERSRVRGRCATVLKCWAEWSAGASARAEGAQAVSTESASRLRRRLLSLWRRAAEEARNVKAGSLHWSLVILRAWNRAAEKSRQSSIRLAVGVRAWRAGRCALTLAAWRQWALREVERKCRLSRFYERRRKRTQRCCMEAWAGQAEEAAQERVSEGRAVLHKLVRLLLRALRAWESAVATAELVREAVARGRRRTLVWAFRGWEQRAAAKVTTELQRRRAVRYAYFHALIAGMAGFFLAAERRHRRNIRYGRCNAHRDANLLRRSLHVWVNEFCPEMRLARQQGGRAAMLWRGQLLLRALLGWTAVLPVLKAAKASANLATQHARLSLLSGGLQAWVLYKARRVEKLLRVGVLVEKVRERLSMKARVRIFEAWSAVHRKCCLRRMKWLRGVSHRNAQILQCTLRTWQAWLSSKRRAQSLRLSALQHFTKRRLGAAMAGWRRAKGTAIEKRAKQSSAMHRWATLMKWKALKWWKEYLSLRKSKKEAMGRALRSHHKQLLKEGAAQWLRVGLWRRDLRVSARAEEAARKAREDVINAEKFSRKWRHLVRSPGSMPRAPGVPDAGLGEAGKNDPRADEEPRTVCAARSVQDECLVPPPDMWGSEPAAAVGHAEVFDHASWTGLAGSAGVQGPGRFSSASSLASYGASTCGSLFGKKRPKPRRPVEILGHSTLANTLLPPHRGAAWERPSEAHPPRLSRQALQIAPGGRLHAPLEAVIPPAPPAAFLASDAPTGREVAERIRELQEEILLLQARQQVAPGAAPLPA